MEGHSASVQAGLVQHEVDALAKFNISREQILAKYWELPNIDPAKGYNTSRQSKALELIWKGLGYADVEQKKPSGYGKLATQIMRMIDLDTKEQWMHETDRSV